MRDNFFNFFTNQLNILNEKKIVPTKKLVLNHWILRFKNRCNKVVIELRVVKLWPEKIRMISNQTRAAHPFESEITWMISDPIALHSAQLLLLIYSGSKDTIFYELDIIINVTEEF